MLMNCRSWSRVSITSMAFPPKNAIYFNTIYRTLTLTRTRYFLDVLLLLIIIIIIITTAIFVVLSSTAPAICESSLWFIWAKVGQRQVAANSQAKLQT